MKRIILILSLICTICTLVDAQNNSINGYYSINNITKPFWAEDICYSYTETGIPGGGILEINLTDPVDASTIFTWAKIDQMGGTVGDLRVYNNGRIAQMPVSTSTSSNNEWVLLRVNASDGSSLVIKVYIIPSY